MTEMILNAPIMKSPRIRLTVLAALIAGMEIVVLLLIHMNQESVIPVIPHEPIRITLAPPAPPKSQPKAAEAHAVTRPDRKTVVPKKVIPKTLSPSTDESKTFFVAAPGQAVSLGWGASTPAGAPGTSEYLPPVLLTKVDTSRLYTDKMRDSGEEGDVVIDVWVDPAGKLSRYRVLIPSVYDDINDVAFNLMKTLRFRPATYKGNPVSGKFQLSFRFRINNG